MEWDPAKYVQFGDHRHRPFFDLTGRVYADRPVQVVDLGCGPGNLTATLAERWPAAEVVGVDSSSEMLAKTAALTGANPAALANVRTTSGARASTSLRPERPTGRACSWCP